MAKSIITSQHDSTCNSHCLTITSYSCDDSLYLSLAISLKLFASALLWCKFTIFTWKCNNNETKKWNFPLCYVSVNLQNYLCWETGAHSPILCPLLCFNISAKTSIITTLLDLQHITALSLCQFSGLALQFSCAFCMHFFFYFLLLSPTSQFSAYKDISFIYLFVGSFVTAAQDKCNFFFYFLYASSSFSFHHCQRRPCRPSSSMDDGYLRITIWYEWIIEIINVVIP